MLKKIKFYAIDEYTSNVKLKPVPAAKFLPQWFKDMPTFSNDDKKIKLNPAPSITAKKCAPLFDGLISGYIMPLWSDIYVSQVDGHPYIQWFTSEPVADAWSLKQSSTYEIPSGFDNLVFKYLHGWIPQTPKNYSCLIIHPIGYPNLPIRTIPGVIDSDILKTEANVPFVIKKGFEGIIKKGTPMFQIIPFKRENWKAEYDVFQEKEYFYNVENLKTKIVSSYSSIRQKKSYR